ncbi:EboA domain-containing protein [Streptomyces sulfonofaciens]|uniref:EboA domain-containing protein n=1 Tax=Streptomyces sulfonofaciens TaxID=68272 RepID=UPI001673F6C2|nr:EboA domain-containing protein [Streptomyces sulfonofaciens]
MDARLTAEATAWLDRALAQAAQAGGAGEAAQAARPPAGAAPAGAPAAASGAAAGPAAAPRPPRRLPTWELRFAEAGRRCGPELADAARVLLLYTARPDGSAATRLYTQGSAAERRAVLAALPYLTDGPGGLPLVEDALRTNDTRLVAAAVGPYAAAHLDPHGWRHAVLKCLFTGVPVGAVAGLAARAEGDAELARMLGDYAEERRAAGRPVPDDLYRVLDLTGVTASPEARTAPGPPPAPAPAPAPATARARTAPPTGEES